MGVAAVVVKPLYAGFIANGLAGNETPVDETAPTLVRALISADAISLTFDEPVEFGAGGNGGFALTASGGALTMATPIGDGTVKLTYSLSRTPDHDETITLAYTQPTDGVQDLAGNDLESFSGFSVRVVGRFASIALLRRRRR